MNTLLSNYKNRLANLSSEEMAKRREYLHDIASGKIFGPQTGYASIDKPWLKWYDKNYINLDVERTNVFDYFLNATKDFGDSPILNYYGQKFSREDIKERVEKNIKLFKSMGLKAGDTVSVIMLNTPEVLFMWYALSKLGVTTNMIKFDESPERIKYMMNLTKSKYLFASAAPFILNSVNEVVKSNDNVEKVIIVDLFETLNEEQVKNMVINQAMVKNEMARAKNEPEQPIQEVETKNKKTIEEVSQYLHVSSKDVVKTMIYKTPEEFVAVLVRGDKEVNPIQVCNALNIAEHELQLATNQEIQTLGSVEGFVGPVDLNIKILVDQEVALMKNIIVGANQADYHLINVNFNRDFKGEVGCFRKCQDGDACPICGQPLKSQRGIEVGQIFKLRTKYSESMGCTFLNEEGKSIPMVMGCYGIGVTRTLAAIVEQYHDEHGIIWPIHLAPYQVVIIPINYAEAAQQQLADECYALLKQHHVEVILDDRNSKAGFKFKDWDLIGIPLQIIVGKKASEGIVEFKQRKTQNKEELSLQQVVEKILNCI